MRISTPTSVRTALLAGSLLVGGVLALPLASGATPTAPAPKPPSVYTGSFSEVSVSSATLKSGVNPRGNETTCYFQYGPTTTYGSQTPPTSVGAGVQEVKIAQSVTSLQPNTTYHYRVVATSSAGTTVGEDRSFTTKKIPLTLEVSVKPSPQVFGGSFSITGTLSGTESANHAIVLQAKPFPYLGAFKDVGNPELTNAVGGFVFPYSGLTQNTEFRVATIGSPAVTSRTVIELVAVRVSLHARRTRRRGFFLIYGDVAPAEPGALVVLQRVRRGHKPQGVITATVKSSRSSAMSRFSRLVHIRHPGSYRAFVSVLNGRQVSYYSRTVRIR